jgi:hypothetical protein
VVANLVGIILILIMVVGTQVRNAIVAAGREPPIETAPAAPTPIERELATAQSSAAAVERDFKNLGEKMAREQFEIDYRRLERDRIATLVAAAESTLAEKRGALSAAQQAEYDLYAQLNQARRELRDLKLARDAALNTPETPGIIEHLPTPLAKTVFGKELHLRLDRGKIAYVPLNEMIAILKDDAQRNAWKLKDAQRMTETLGPVDGFRMKYTLARTEKTVSTNGGVARATYVELERFILLPVTDDLGEPLDLALAPGSATRGLLKDYPPDRTTITVWVYPESFQEFRRFKAEMFKLGYATAGRPMPAGHPIGGSPDGTHSSAQ